MQKLNLGCEDQILRGFTNVDINNKLGVDLVYDLNNLPLPFEDDSIDYILCSHLLEHLSDPLSFIHDLYRISKDGSVIDIFVPHFSAFTTYADLTHKKPGMSYFTLGNHNFNKSLFYKFQVSKKLNFTRINFSWLNKIFNPIINLSPILYERFLCYILPCSEIHFRLKVIK
jgi:predicted SAM-dependent methyltransferase